MGLGSGGLGQVCLQAAPPSAWTLKPLLPGPAWTLPACAQGPFAAALGHCSDLCRALMEIFKGKRPCWPQNTTQDKDKACLGQNSLSRPCTECTRM